MVTDKMVYGGFAILRHEHAVSDGSIVHGVSATDSLTGELVEFACLDEESADRLFCAITRGIIDNCV